MKVQWNFIQGDGTAFIFQDRPQVFTVSVHGAGNFPTRKQNSDLDIALPDDTNDDAYLGYPVFSVDMILPASLHCRYRLSTTEWRYSRKQLSNSWNAFGRR